MVFFFLHNILSAPKYYIRRYTRTHIDANTRAHKHTHWRAGAFSPQQTTFARLGQKTPSPTARTLGHFHHSRHHHCRHSALGTSHTPSTFSQSKNHITPPSVRPPPHRHRRRRDSLLSAVVAATAFRGRVLFWLLLLFLFFFFYFYIKFFSLEWFIERNYGG